tara:strand:+ start:562 stop:918 length:357 start_codon:yes stop_codon:yes gene_type:complete
MIKTIYGLTGAVVILLSAAAIGVIGNSQSKASNFQVNAITCSIEGRCLSLLKFGVNPDLYQSDVNYRKVINKKYMAAVMRNSTLAPEVAQFTLQYGFRRSVDVSLDVYEVLHRLAQNS